MYVCVCFITTINDCLYVLYTVHVCLCVHVCMCVCVCASSRQSTTVYMISIQVCMFVCACVCVCVLRHGNQLLFICSLYRYVHSTHKLQAAAYQSLFFVVLIALSRQTTTVYVFFIHLCMLQCACMHACGCVDVSQLLPICSLYRYAVAHTSYGLM